MLIKNNISQIVLAIAVLFVAIFLLNPLAEAAVIEKDLGVVLYTQAPKTWTIDVPQDFNTVEVGVYPMGKTEINQYGGWNAYLKLNGEYAWKFVRHDTKLGGIIYDYIKGAEVLETAGRGKWLDVTSGIKAGKNTIIYYHYTGGDGIGVKVRIYTTTSTLTLTPTPTMALTPTKTPTPIKTSTPTPTWTPTPTVGMSASISLYDISPSYNAGDTLSAAVYVKNTGGSSHTFPVGFSVRDPDGNWIDIPYKKLILYPGSGGYVYFTYSIPSSGSGGQWLARAAVWDSEAGSGKLSTRYGYKDQTFVVLINLTTPKPTQTMPGRYTREGPKTIEESVKINCESSNPSDVSLYKTSDERGYLCVNNVIYNALKIKLETVDPYGAPVSDVEVSKQVIDKAQIVMDIITGQFTGLIVGAAMGAAGVPTVILKAMDVKDLIELPGKIQKLGEEEYVIIGKTDRSGLMETWVIENQETRFTAFQKLPPVFGSPQAETDHSIQKLLGKYPWTGRVTVTASSPKTEEIRLKRSASVVVIHGGGSDSGEIVNELQNFFRRESGVEIISMTFETAESQQNLAKDKLLQEADGFIYILTNKDNAHAQIYYGDGFMPTLINREINDNGRKYTNEANGIVSYRFYESDNNLNGRNYYLIAGIGNKGLKSAFESFKKGEWKIVVGSEPSKPAPARRPWWKFW